MCKQLVPELQLNYFLKQPSKLTKCSSNRYKVSVMIQHDRITMTIQTSIPCEDGFLARIVKYFNLNYFIKTETKTKKQS